MRLAVFYNVVKFHSPTSNTFRDMNYHPVLFLVKSIQTDGQKVKWHRWAQQGTDSPGSFWDEISDLFII